MTPAESAKQEESTSRKPRRCPPPLPICLWIARTRVAPDPSSRLSASQHRLAKIGDTSPDGAHLRHLHDTSAQQRPQHRLGARASAAHVAACGAELGEGRGAFQLTLQLPIESQEFE